MSSKKKARQAERKKPEQEPDLSIQYGEIGIKAVAAAADRKGKTYESADGDQGPKKSTEEKPNG